MTVTQRARGRVPLDQRSVIPSVTGVPWWGAFACAAIAIAIGYLVDAMAGTELTMFFSTMYLVGCLVAVLMVQNKSIFTAMVQPPLLMVIAVPLAYKSFVVGPTQGLKSLILDLALPLIDRFPTMVFTTMLIWIIGAFRLTLYIQEKRGKSLPAGSRRAPRKPTKPPVRETAPGATASSTASSRVGAAAPSSPRRSADTRQAGQVRRTPPPSRTQQPPVEPPRGARRAAVPADPRQPERPARPRHDDPAPTRSARGHRYADEPRRATTPPPPPATPPRRARPPQESAEPATRRRPPPESVREYTDRQGDTPRYRADRPAAPRPATPPEPRPKRDHPLPNVRYRD